MSSPEKISATANATGHDGQRTEEHENGQHVYDSPEEESEEESVDEKGDSEGSERLGDAGEGVGAVDNHDTIEDGDEDQDDGDEEDDEDDEDEDEDDDDDDEPALKYERIGGSVQDLFKKDSASAIAVSPTRIAIGTHAGLVHVLDLEGTRLKSYKSHLASIIDISLDSTSEFAATASLDGQVVIRSLVASETYSFDLKRPMRSVAMEPDFSKRGTRAFVCGGMAGTLVLHEKGWLGHKETVLHANEGPIWQIRWRDRLIAWANDLGVKIYDTVSQSRITFIDRPSDSPRPDLFKCTLYWQDDSTLLIAWADYIKVARIRARTRNTTSLSSTTANLPPLIVEITAVFKLDCMVAGIVPHPDPLALPTSTPSLTSLLILAYSPPDTSFLHADDLVAEDKSQQARKLADRPELRIISRSGDELAADAISLTGYQSWGCNDYALVEADSKGGQRCYIVMSPRDIIVVKPRDRKDHIQWLVERQRYEEALAELEILEQSGVVAGGFGEEEGGLVLSATEIGGKYIQHLVDAGEYEKAARLCPKVCAQDAKRWEDWIFVFAEAKKLPTIIPLVPTESPRLDRVVYEMIIAFYLGNDRPALVATINSWPKGIYDISAVIFAVRTELDRLASSSKDDGPVSGDAALLMECLAELYTANRQPGKALPYYLRLRRPNVFDLIRDNNLFTDVQDQVLLLIEFDHELMEKRKSSSEGLPEGKQRESEAVTMLVNHVHSIPIGRVVQQLQTKPYYLFLYLDSLFSKDAYLASDFADLQVKLYAQYAPAKLLDFLRASTFYNLEQAYDVCSKRELVIEMVFLLGRMGDNRKALTLIIERLGDVKRAIEFAKEQADDDLWEDLLKYSETRPAFIRGLLENVGAEIDPIRLIRRIKLGLEIPGLKEALIKILHDFHLQISLLEGCQTILNGDSSDVSRKLQRSQTGGFFLTGKSVCPVCNGQLQELPQGVVLLYLCRHVVHARCVQGGDNIPSQPDPVLRGIGMGSAERGINGKIAFTSIVRSHVKGGCPVCRLKGEGGRT